MDFSTLDQDELFQLALEAVNQGQHAEAITLLKTSLEQNADDARLHYLLGVEYAQIGLSDRAVSSLTTAVQHAPDLSMAVFQLGLLHLTRAEPDQAIATWTQLDSLDQDHFLRLFKTGLENLIRDEFATCKQQLLQGIAVNATVPSLNKDMQLIIEQIEQQDTTQKPAAPTNFGSAYLGAYANYPSDTLQ